jgi:hypothetical protein
MAHSFQQDGQSTWANAKKELSHRLFSSWCCLIFAVDNDSKALARELEMASERLALLKHMETKATEYYYPRVTVSITSREKPRKL